MKILVTGANGFLGSHLVPLLVAQGETVIGTGRSALSSYPVMNGYVYEKMDFTDPYSIHDLFEKHQPVMIVHAGAMTKVDECEENQWAAYTTNVEGTLNLLSNAAEHAAFFILVSTDFIFDGMTGNYTEECQAAPLNFYGKTKAEAEQAVMEYEYPWAIVRTSLVYGKPVSGKDNIIGVVKKKLELGEHYGLVNDQFRSPTFVNDLAAGILLIMKQKAKGIFHLAGKELLTPYEMGIKTAGKMNVPVSLVRELNASSFSQPAKRPARTNLSIEKAIRELGYDPVTFEEGLARTLSL